MSETKKDNTKNRERFRNVPTRRRTRRKKKKRLLKKDE